MENSLNVNLDNCKSYYCVISTVGADGSTGNYIYGTEISNACLSYYFYY